MEISLSPTRPRGRCSPAYGPRHSMPGLAVIESLRQTVRRLGTRDLTELQGRLSGNAYLTFRYCFTDRLLSRLKVRIHLAPPTSLLIIGHFRELSEIRACARDLPSHADPRERRRGANRPNFADPLCARFPYVRPHAIGGTPIGGRRKSAKSGETYPGAISAGPSARHSGIGTIYPRGSLQKHR
jgi:hypothetical protein